MKKRTQLSLPNYAMSRSNPHSEKMTSHDHSKMAFGMGGIGTAYSLSNRNVDEFGGEPFSINKG